MGKIPAGQASFTLKLNDQLSGKLAGVASKVKGGMAAIGKGAMAAGQAIVGVFKMAAKAALALGAGAIAAATAFAAFGDKIGKMSIRTRLSVEALQELKFAAEQSGTNLDSLGQALFRVRRRIGNAVSGTGPAVRALDELGLSAAELSKQDPSEQFKTLVGALSEVGNEARRNQLAFELFGDNFRDIQPLIDQGAEGIGKLQKEFKELGITLSADQIKDAEKLTDAWNKFKTGVAGVIRLIGAELAPTFTRVLDSMTDKISTVATLVRKWPETFDFVWDSIKVGALSLKVGMINTFTSLGLTLADAVVLPVLRAIELAESAMEKLTGKSLGIADTLRKKYQAGTAGMDNVGLAAQTELANAMAALAAKRTDLVMKPEPGDGRVPGPEPGDYADGLGAGTGARPEPIATTGIMSGFAAKYAAAFGYNRSDPKKEEKEMVGLLEQIADAGPLVVQPGG